MNLTFRAVAEDAPGPKWAGLFAEYKAAYLKWWGREGLAGRPTYLECRGALAHHMPEMLELYDTLVVLAGGGDPEARFLWNICFNTRKGMPFTLYNSSDT